MLKFRKLYLQLYLYSRIFIYLRMITSLPDMNLPLKLITLFAIVFCASLTLYAQEDTSYAPGFYDYGEMNDHKPWVKDSDITPEQAEIADRTYAVILSGGIN